MLLMTPSTLDMIDVQTVKSLCGLFKERVKRTPDAVAYRYFDFKANTWKDQSWQQSAARIARIQAAMRADNLKAGDRVAIMLRNCPEWVHYEQAALGLGLVVVPLYTNDRADNIAYVLQDAGVKALLIEGQEQLQSLSEIEPQIGGLVRLVCVEQCQNERFPRLSSLHDWTEEACKDKPEPELQTHQGEPEDLATIVYTSGTTGRPKGVMLSHDNILYNANAAVPFVETIYREDVWLSFLPLSHMLERTVGYYIPMMGGCTVAFARSVPQLAEDLLSIKPTIMVSVPRIYERVYGKISAGLKEKSPFARKLFHKAVDTGWDLFKHPEHSHFTWPILKALVANKVMAKLGGRLRLAICGGAPLSTEVAKTFIGLGLNLIQGYGLTETSPIISANQTRNNDPASVGPALPGIEVKIGDQDELLTRSRSVMLGYWHNQEATAETIDSDGWLHTGDKAKIENGFIYITGRLKEIIVLANGEKVPPADMEMAIAMDPLFEQSLVIGEQKPYLSALLVLNPVEWALFAEQLGLDPRHPDSLQQQATLDSILSRIADLTHQFPGYAKVRQVHLSLEPWSIENGLLTPTLKTKRKKIIERHQADVDKMYEGH